MCGSIECDTQTISKDSGEELYAAITVCVQLTDLETFVRFVSLASRPTVATQSSTREMTTTRFHVETVQGMGRGLSSVCSGPTIEMDGTPFVAWTALLWKAVTLSWHQQWNHTTCW